MDPKLADPKRSVPLRVLEWLLSPLPPQPFLDRARTGFFGLVVLVASVFILSSLASIALKAHWASLVPESLVLLFLLGLLFLIWKGFAKVAVGLLSVIVPLAFDLRFSQDPYYLLAFAAATLVSLTLVSSRARFLFLAGVLFGLAGLYPKVQLRYVLILAFLTMALALLQWVLGQATKMFVDSEVRLRLVLEERTAKLGQANAKLDRARRSLASGEKMFSLGQVIAGVAHQVNTPLAAIQSSQAHLQHRLFPMVQQWTALGGRLPGTSLALLWELRERCREDWPLPSSREGRDLRASIEQQLLALGSADAEIKAEMLAELGLVTLDAAWREVAALPSAVEVLRALLELVQLERSLAIVAVATEKASAHVLALSRFATPVGTIPEPETVDLVENLETVLEVYRSQIPETLELVCSLPPQGLFLKGHPEQLMLVWSNLLSNARQALQDKGTITVLVEVLPTTYEVQIRDHGPAIPDNLRQTLLQPFQVSRTAHDTGRISLGLEIVLNILSRHKGSLTFESVPGNTEFKVTLPRS